MKWSFDLVAYFETVVDFFAVESFCAKAKRPRQKVKAVIRILLITNVEESKCIFETVNERLNRFVQRDAKVGNEGGMKPRNQ